MDLPKVMTHELFPVPLLQLNGSMRRTGSKSVLIDKLTDAFMDLIAHNTLTFEESHDRSCRIVLAGKYWLRRWKNRKKIPLPLVMCRTRSFTPFYKLGRSISQ